MDKPGQNRRNQSKEKYGNRYPCCPEYPGQPEEAQMMNWPSHQYCPGFSTMKQVQD